MPILLLLAGVVILAGVVGVAMGRGGEMAEFAMDYPPPDVVTAADVSMLRPPSSLWGYNAQLTDEALSQIAQVISERDVEIAVLRQQLAELRSATGSHPAITATLLARSRAAAARADAAAGGRADAAGRGARIAAAPVPGAVRVAGSGPGCRAGGCRDGGAGPRMPGPRIQGRWRMGRRRAPRKRPPAAMTDPAGLPEPGPDGQLRCPWALSAPEYLAYHDDEWGRPVRDDRGIFERLSLEAFQSGLSWLTILRKRENFRAAFAGFDPAVVAGFGPGDVARLLADAGIIRNRAKIAAVIGNARAALAVPGGLAALLWGYAGDPADTAAAPVAMAEVPASSPESTALARDLRARGFSFTGPVTVYAAFQACGVVDDHLRDCFRRGAFRTRPVEHRGS